MFVSGYLRTCPAVHYLVETVAKLIAKLVEQRRKKEAENAPESYTMVNITVIV